MGTSKWNPLKDADGKSGVRYREHQNRKHGAIPDRYFSLAYWWQGRTVTEGLGWASDGWTPTRCFKELADLRRNQSRGHGPCTMSEKRKQAKRERERIEKEAEKQAARDISFKSFFDDIYYPDPEARIKPDTLRRVKGHVTNWIDPETRFIPIKELDLSHVKKIRSALVRKKTSPGHQRLVFHTFTSVWNAAEDLGIVEGPSPTKSRSFKLPKIDNERQRYLTIEEEKKLFEAVRKRSETMYQMSVVSIDTGLRFSEVAGLTFGCLDLDQGIIRVLNTKGKRDRFVPLTDRVKRIFDEMEQGKPKDIIFPTRNGTRKLQVPSTFWRAVKDAKLNDDVDDPKMRACYHSLRHTYASRLVQAGDDLYRVQRLLGHSSPVMTARYSKLADHDLRQALKAMESSQRAKKSGGRVISMKGLVK